MTDGSRRRTVVLIAVAAVVLVAFVLPSGPRTANRSILPSDSGGFPSSISVLPGGSPAAGTSVEVAPAFTPSSGVTAVGPVPPANPISVVVGLALPDPSSLAGRVSAIYAPGTPDYHAFLTPSELAQSFGPPASAVSAARAYFGGFGLTASPSPDHLLLTVTGPSARVGAAFGTTFEQYRSADGRWFVSHPTAASLPAVAPWSGAYGLGNATPLIPAAGPPVPLPTTIAPAASCAGTSSILVPCQVWQAYNMTSLISGGTNGSGVRLAVVDPYSAGENQSQLASDLAAFTSQNGLTPGSVNYLYPDPAPGNLNSSANPAWNVEDALDLEWARASAPGATIDMTFSPDAGAGLYAAVDWLVAHQAANVISMSWGEPDVGVFNAYNGPCAAACNASTDGSYGILAPVLAFAAAEGISVFAASGDCGAADGTSGLSTNFPASNPDVTGVGGTVLSVNASGRYLSEMAWNGTASGAHAPGCTNQGGSGGGYSPFPRPWWQTGAPSSATGRGVPDVSADAATAVLLIFQGGAIDVEGTSVSTPFWAGVAAIADQYSGGPLGLLNPSLYAIASGTNYARDFHDITAGNNGYAAGPGWDPVTGLGTPRVAALVVDLAHRVPVSTSDLAVFVYATPRFGKAPLTVTFHVNATGGTGTYPLEGVSFGDGNASFAPGGTATYTFERPGVYSAQAYVADSIANDSISPPVAIVVGGGNALAVSLAASTDVPARGAPVLFSVGVTGGVTPYQYNFSFGDGTYLDGSRSSATSHVFGASGSFCAAVVVSDAASPVNGGTSARVAIGVGGVGLPDCRNDTVPLTMSPAPNLGVRDAPAEFPGLFLVSGGSTAAGTLPPSVQFSSTDPYLAACSCAIFRSPGTFPVRGYGNDSENEQATATTSVTVAPPLEANFTASPTYGPAPLTVTFGANASGGYGASSVATVWTFGNGSGSVGATASFTYPTPGWFVAVGHLSDLGHGNASEAFLIDVRPSSGPSVPFLTATVRPAVDVPLGASVNFSAQSYSASGAAVPSVFRWTISPGSGAYRPSFNWTLSAVLPGPGNRTLDTMLSAADRSTGAAVSAGLDLEDFTALEPGGFVPRVDALTFSDSAGPAAGAALLNWSGSGSARGPGTTVVLWAFGNGFAISDPMAQHFFSAGEYTVVATAKDSWGDTATDVHPVEVFGALELTASLSATAGAAPLTVTFRSNATGGIGPPYQYLWEFGDNGSAASANGTHTFAGPGVYGVTLNASDSGRDSIARTWTVTVTPGATNFPSVALLVASAAAGVGLALAVTLGGRRRSPGGTASP